MAETRALVDLDLRLVHCFSVLAQYQHFGRAAVALHTTQPSLTRQIRRLENQVGTRLLERSPRGTSLTPAGEAFLPLADELLTVAGRALAQTHAVGVSRAITIGYTMNLIVTRAAQELSRLHPTAEVRTRHLSWDQPRTALLEHQVDAVLTRSPLNTQGLETIVLREEPRVLLLSTGHRLAERTSLTLDDIADEPMPRTSDPGWNAFWRIDPRPDGRPAPTGPLLEDLEDKSEAVASGRAVAIVPAGEYIQRLRPDLTTVPVAGLAPSEVLMATRRDDHRPLTRALQEIAKQVLSAED
ncbi:LysR family transcriptional regulator [Kineosporia babensis]|uniref:LysR family transcriptional regulator n=1 Tax=Kineosporia babensis TaxID=499548 RepID=A0A9X1NPZ2_9ACTN|nr:LysR family transcriptional regulator [Kineosporia babensis]